MASRGSQARISPLTMMGLSVQENQAELCTHWVDAVMAQQTNRFVPRIEGKR